MSASTITRKQRLEWSRKGGLAAARVLKVRPSTPRPKLVITLEMRQGWGRKGGLTAARKMAGRLPVAHQRPARQQRPSSRCACRAKAFARGQCQDCYLLAFRVHQVIGTLQLPSGRAHP